MAVGVTIIGETPCCGLIERTWEYNPHTGHHSPHDPGQPEYAPTFQKESRWIDEGFCPDCRKRFAIPDGYTIRYESESSTSTIAHHLPNACEYDLGDIIEGEDYTGALPIAFRYICTQINDAPKGHHYWKPIQKDK